MNEIKTDCRHFTCQCSYITKNNISEFSGKNGMNPVKVLIKSEEGKHKHIQASKFYVLHGLPDDSNGRRNSGKYKKENVSVSRNG